MGDGTGFAESRWENLTGEMAKIQAEISSLRRAMEGDDREGWSGLQGRVKKLEQDAEVLSKELERMTWRYNALATTFKWLGPSGVMLIVAFIGYIWQQGGITP